MHPPTFLATALPSLRRITARRLLSVLLPALAGLAWTLSSQPYGVGLSPLLIVGVLLAESPLGRFLAALAYFGVGSAALPSEVQSFFGSGCIVGIGLWVLSSTLLAAPWAWASRGWRVVAVLLIEALPPLGFFGWLSPLAVAGVLFPGMGVVGLLLCLALFWARAESMWTDDQQISAPSFLAPVSRGLFVLVVVANALYAPPAAPYGWIGVNTRVDHETDDVIAEVARNQQWINQAAAAVAAAPQDHGTPAARDAKAPAFGGAQAGAKKQGGVVVVLPEDVAGTWGPGTAAQARAAMRPGDVWLVGASVLADRVRWDGRYLNAVVGLGQRGDALLFASPVPVPGGMWKPWNREKSYTASHWWEPVRTIAGVRTWASICYDQGLAWPWLQALVQRPAVVLRVSNYWYEPAGAVAPRVEAATTAAWARLMGAAVVTAVNRG
ncbi:putative TraB [Thiomonas arsenitoxydans]|uniref:TraB n=1 Tax=Thiomonas arsenitoxydans (strain DSM 22701 / CIP 110005 / 3As) TaxID=426114 RepID=A0ABP1Z069_THIA3|nr:MULTISPECIES: hypothetical protein [Thiomonas]MDE1978873.1 hypothetical protein [Betaproteobacteria bacterium]CQR44245.1 putative TraB [Thiomonas sp. CB3]MDE2269271.1 hypothetical protein [Betaproteobacteria bacterium]CDW95905.1 putative TraB family protein [Thiomonas sp. CB2]CQR26403.1 putative TraB [Thiomonas arsenitoxydans]